MAGDAIIGALRVVLGADTAALEKGLKDAQGKINAFAAGAGKGLAGIAVGVAAAATALGVSIKHTLDEADKLGKLSQSIGVPVEQLSALKYAADLSGVSLESLGKALGKLSRNTVEAAQGAQAPVQAFQTLGISFRDATGGVKSVSDLLPQLADRFAAMKDGTVKTALAIQIFGRSGAELIPLLNEGSKGLKEMTDEAAALGLIIDQKTYKSAEAFNDNLTRMSAIFHGLIVRVTAEVAPAFAQLSGALVEVSKNSDLIKSLGEGISTALKGTINTVIVASTVFERLGIEFTALKAIFSATSFADLKTAFDNFKAEGDKTAQVFAGLGATLDKFWEAASKNAETASKHVAKTFDPQIIKTTKDALDSYIASTEKHIAAQNAEAAAVGKAAGEREKLKVIAEAQSIADSNHIVITDQMRASLDALAASAGQAALKLQGAQLVQQSLPIMQQYQMQLDNTKLALIAVGATADQTQLAIDALNQRFQNSSENIMQGFGQIAGSLSSLTGTFAKENKAMGIASKAFGIAQAIINTQVAITKAFATLPPPASYVAAAVAVAQGAASIATIAAQKFATGGAIRVGGSGGTDSQLVQIMASPDEQIDVWRPGEGPDPRRGAGGGVTNIFIPREAAQINRGYIEQLIPALNSAIGDGHKIRLVPA